jgi:acetolactate decarboxylase
LTTHHAPHRELDRHEVFQTGTMGALIDGIYDGDCSVEHLLTRGDFGVGTFNALDGEMLLLDGTCYRLSSDGSVGPTASSVQTPFAVVTRFEAHVTQRIDEPLTQEEMRDLLVGLTPSDNYLYAYRIQGEFASVRTRTVARQSPPYRRLVEVTKGEPVQMFSKLSGDIVGFRTPVFQRGIGIAGDHAHFIDELRTQGGHVLDFVLTRGTLEVCIGTDLHLELPRTVAFERADLDDDPVERDAEVTASERHT